eukprot:179684_1
MSAVVNTDVNGEGQLDINEESCDFSQWLKNKGVQKSLRDKMIQNGLDSMDVLSEIDRDDKDEINKLSSELNLTTIEKLKFKSILKQIPMQSLNIMVDPQERKAILEMKQKLQKIQQSITNINQAKKNIANEVSKCSKLITTTYDNIADKLMKQKEASLTQLKTISDNKVNLLDEKYKLMLQNADVVTSHINNCYGAINKKIDLIAIDTRKENILKLAKAVDDIDIIDENNPLVVNYGIDMVCNTSKVNRAIDEVIHFVSIPKPILISLQQKQNKLNVKWKLEKYERKNAEKDEVNKLRVELCVVSEAENKDDEKMQLDDAKMDWNVQTVDVNNIENDNNEIDIDLNVNKPTKYSVRLQYMINDKGSKYSNIKSVLVKDIIKAKFQFTNYNNAIVTISENGTRVKTDKGAGCAWTAVTSKTGWNSGKYVWKVKCIATKGSHGGDMIGVVTDYDKVTTNPPLNNMGSGVHFAYDCIRTYNGAKRSQITNNIQTFKSDDIMTISMDCDLWKITFHLNETDLGTYDLVPNKKYHPAIALCGCSGYDYKLLL